MAGFTTYLENLIMNAFFRNGTLSRPANIYIGLLTAAPNDEGGGTEVSGGSYARVAVATGASSGWNAPSSGETANTAAITFPTASAGWGTVTHVGLYDASSGGNLLAWVALSASKVVESGDTVSFAAGALDVALD